MIKIQRNEDNIMSTNLTPEIISGDVSISTGDSNEKISESSPAVMVMTDFNRVKPFHIGASASLEDIHEKMVSAGVRLLFVHDDSQKMVGLLTSFDLLGEKPLLHIQTHGGTRNDIEARDIMTPISKLEGIELSKIQAVTVGDIIEVCRHSRRHHMLVIEKNGDNTNIRGLISSSQVSRSLGVEISASQRAESFSQLNKALS